MGYSAWGRKESDTTERLHFTSYRWDTSPASLAINHSSSPASLASPSMITAWTWVSLDLLYATFQTASCSELLLFETKYKAR